MLQFVVVITLFILYVCPLGIVILVLYHSANTSWSYLTANELPVIN